jgi:DNA processing protein
VVCPQCLVTQGGRLTDPRFFWVGFNLVKGIGAARFRLLLDAFGDAERAWHAPAPALRQAGLSSRIVETLQKVRASDLLERTWRQIQAQGIQVFTWEQTSYPRLLKEIEQPPPVLYALGEVTEDDDWAVAIVGTRRVTAYGRQVAEDLAIAMARNGISVVSGLARGIDAIAHQACLKNSGRTLAVLGSGVDHIYPPEHRRLAQEIAAQGAILSDYPPGTPPEASNFPPRNRIISGLARATVVVEAGISSGALITATFAVEQGREVFAVPGGIYSPASQGTNHLIQQGARPYLSPQDILESLNIAMAGEQRTARAVLPADATEAQLYARLGATPMHVDDLRAELNLPVEQVSAALALMELKGLVRHVGGMQYVALREEQSDYQVD